MKINEEADNKSKRSECVNDRSADSLQHLKEDSLIIPAVTSNREEDEATLDEGDLSLYNLDCRRSS